MPPTRLVADRRPGRDGGGGGCVSACVAAPEFRQSVVEGRCCVEDALDEPGGGLGVCGAGEDGDGGVVRPDGATVVAQRAEAPGLGRHRAQPVGVGHVGGGEPCGDGGTLVGVE